MKIKIVLIISGFVLILGLIWVTNSLRGRILGVQKSLLSPISGIESLPSLTPTPTPTETPAPRSPEPSRTDEDPERSRRTTPKPTPTVKPQPEFTSEQIYGFTEKYGIFYAVDPNVIRHVALCESGFKPNAKNYIYAGLFQFDKPTWIYYRQKMGLDADTDLRYHAEEAVRTATYIFHLGKTSLWPNCYPH